ncbi:hypothetical protein AMAG_08773 [Allomyces macrogynus ATCC 38327]|uniref:Amino acid permease n=2 Tax=Allomyces macrogynus (strain ATCC 38327) TaxID=578462 RepID=A0A0L0SM84_ALLM3|nr:hypothetical protein AMAG_08773 [Allomyces macrogynus ATCC 38327]|eukprot:KNE63676.1 hypothetical protein AMAG_08773 [Allomyces macrogynus ATCC 38327]
MGGPAAGFRPLHQHDDVDAKPSSRGLLLGPARAADNTAHSPRDSFDSTIDIFADSHGIPLRPTVGGGGDGDDDGDIEAANGRGTMGLWTSISVIVGAIIGSGIFVSPGPIYSYTNSVLASILIWVLAGIISMSGALCYAELGTLITGNGGEYTYLLEAFGRFPALAFLWTSVTLLKSGSAAILASVCAKYLHRLLTMTSAPPTVERGVDGDSASTAPGILELVVAVLVLTATVAINATSMRSVNRMHSVFMVIKLAAIAVVCAAGITVYARGTGLGPLVVHDKVAANASATGISSHSWVLAMQAALWGFDGWNNLNYVTEKVSQPEKNVPRALILGVALVTVCYVLTNVAYLIVLPASMLRQDQGMVMEFGWLAFGRVGQVLLPVFIVISTFGALHSSIFSGAYLIQSAAQQSHFPAAFATPPNQPPLRALALQWALAAVMLASAQLMQLIHWYAFAAYLFYGATAVALLVLRYVSTTWRYAERPFQVWPTTPVVFLLACTGMLAVSVANEWMHALYLMLWTAFGFLLWAVGQAVNRARAGNVAPAGYARPGAPAMGEARAEADEVGLLRE